MKRADILIVRRQILKGVALVILLACVDSMAQSELEDALEGLNARIADEPSQFHHDRAEVLFRLGRFEDSIKDYDMAARFGWPHDEISCWERGLAQYYAGDFSSAKEQFARYHRVGSLDIENGLWRFLCIAEEEGIEEARATMQTYARKVRPPFPALLAVYLDQGSQEAVLREAANSATTPQDLTTNLFYAHYYLGKYYEITDERAQARKHVEEALKHRIEHFMYICAEADLKRLRQ